MISLSKYDDWRIEPPRFWGRDRGNAGDDQAGRFMLRRNGTRLLVIATVGDGWEHVSVSTATRCPTWEEMSWIATRFFGDEPAMQLHVSSEDRVNYHPFCLHWWRPIGREIPLPSSIFVGPKERRQGT